ncbi:hypothetical protein [Streptomyces sp. NPDC002104]
MRRTAGPAVTAGRIARADAADALLAALSDPTAPGHPIGVAA